MKPSLTPLDTSWILLLDLVSRRMDACLPALEALVALVRAKGTHLTDRKQDAARAATAEALERLGWTVFERDGVTLRFVPAHVCTDGAVGIVVRAAHVRVKLDRQAVKASPGANVVDLAARRNARLAKGRVA